MRQKHTGADGEVKFVAHRNLFVGFMGGRVVVTKRTDTACYEFLAKLGVKPVAKSKSKPKKAQIAMITTLATGFALLLWVFVRQALRNASKDGETSQKLNQLHAAWRRALGRR